MHLVGRCNWCVYCIDMRPCIGTVAFVPMKQAPTISNCGSCKCLNKTAAKDHEPVPSNFARKIVMMQGISSYSSIASGTLCKNDSQQVGTGWPNPCMLGCKNCNHTFKSSSWRLQAGSAHPHSSPAQSQHMTGNCLHAQDSTPPSPPHPTPTPRACCCCLCSVSCQSRDIPE